MEGLFKLDKMWRVLI